MKIRKLRTKKFYNIGPWCIDYLLSLSVVATDKKSEVFSLATNGRKKLNIKTVSVEHFSTVFLFFSPFPLLFKVFFKCHFWQYLMIVWLGECVTLWLSHWDSFAVSVFINECVHIRVFSCMNACMHFCMTLWMYVFMCVCTLMHECTCVYVWMCLYLCMNVSVFMFGCVCIHV